MKKWSVVNGRWSVVIYGCAFGAASLELLEHRNVIGIRRIGQIPFKAALLVETDSVGADERHDMVAALPFRKALSTS
jgi:hypothetical protein